MSDKIQNTGVRAIGAVKKELSHQKIILFVCFLLPPLVTSGVIWALFEFQEMLYGPDKNWYEDPFTAIIITLFIFGQLFSIIQYIQYLRKSFTIQGLTKTIERHLHVNSIEEINEFSEEVAVHAPNSDEKHLVLNWLDASTQNKRSSSSELTDNAFNRHELKREKTVYFHILLNRITLKLGFLGTLIGLVMTFPHMKQAILRLGESDGEMRFITDIAQAIDGDKYAILTTMLATVLSLAAEFVTIQLITRISINFELIMSYMMDWYHSTIVPIFEQDTLDAGLEKRRKEAEKAMAENMVAMTNIAKQTATQLEQVSKFQAKLAERVAELDQYEQNYRQFLASKGHAVAPQPLKPEEAVSEA